METRWGSSLIVPTDGRRAATSSTIALAAASPSDFIMTSVRSPPNSRKNAWALLGKLAGGAFLWNRSGARHPRVPLSSHKDSHSDPSFTRQKPVVQ